MTEDKPKDLSHITHLAYRMFPDLLFRAEQDRGVIIESDHAEWTIHSKSARRLATFLIEAADWLEARERDG